MAYFVIPAAKSACRRQPCSGRRALEEFVQRGDRGKDRPGRNPDDDGK